MMMEAAAGKGLNASDYPTLNFPYEWRASAVGGESPVETAGRTKTLRVGPSLASMQCDRVMGPNGASGGEGRGAVGNDAVPFQGCGGEEENHPELGGGGGTIALASPRCIVLFALGGVTCSERRLAYEASKKYGRGVIIGAPRCCVLRCVCAGTWHPRQCDSQAGHAQERIGGGGVGTHTNTHDCGCLWGLCALRPALCSSPWG
ncbi:retrotransposon hot spot (RHS) protein, putative, partial [Trypanosoma cruzi marinkellei]